MDRVLLRRTVRAMDHRRLREDLLIRGMMDVVTTPDKEDEVTTLGKDEVIMPHKAPAPTMPETMAMNTTHATADHPAPNTAMTTAMTTAMAPLMPAMMTMARADATRMIIRARRDLPDVMNTSRKAVDGDGVIGEKGEKVEGGVCWDGVDGGGMGRGSTGGRLGL